MLSLIPLMVIPLIAYNVLVLAGAGTAALGGEIMRINMLSGGVWTMTNGDMLVAAALLVLFIEILKATRTSNASVLDHLLSTLVLIVFLVEFLLVPAAATSVFFILMLITAVDVMAGFSVSIRSAGRDVSFN